MRALIIVLVLLALAALIGGVLIYSGWYNVAATEPHTAPTRALLTTVMKQSVRSRAGPVAASDLSSPDMIRKGAQHYDENCVVCHGAPGKDKGDIGKGLTPPPPDLAKAVKEWTAAELYWIVKHGIRMTGMPAWGVSHKDEDLWAIVAFLTRIPDLSANEYQALKAQSEKPHAR